MPESAADPVRLLVTGFEPFGSYALNSSAEVVRALRRRSPAGLEQATAVLPVVYGDAVEALSEAVAASEPDVVVSFGQIGGRHAIAVERVARNASLSAEPDAAGRSGYEVPPVEGGPLAYASTLPVGRIVSELRRGEMPAVASDDAGSYVCNHVFYGLMHLLATERPGSSGGFVHLPLLREQEEGGMPLDRLTRAVETVVRTAAAAHRGS